MGANAGIYWLVVNDAQRGEYIVVQVIVASADPATVVGRWNDRVKAEADAVRWTDLEAQVA